MFHAQFELQTSTARIIGQRESAPGGPVWVLVHGWGENIHLWDSAEAPLLESGCDVWKINLLGHGRGALESTPKSLTEESYSVENIFFTLGQALDQIHERTGRRLNLVGHSLGGILLELYAAGATIDPQGGLSRDDSLAENRRPEQLDGLLAIAAPFALNHPIQQKCLDFLVSSQGILKVRDCFPGAAKTLLEFLVRFMPGLRAAIGSAINGLIDVENLSAQELVKYIVADFNPVPDGLISSFARYRARGNCFLAQNTLHVPTLLVSGTDDAISPPQVGAEALMKFGAAVAVEHMIIRSAAHVDLVYGDQVLDKFPSILSRFRTIKGTRQGPQPR